MSRICISFLALDQPASNEWQPLPPERSRFLASNPWLQPLILPQIMLKPSPYQLNYFLQQLPGEEGYGTLVNELMVRGGEAPIPTRVRTRFSRLFDRKPPKPPMPPGSQHPHLSFWILWRGFLDLDNTQLAKPQRTISLLFSAKR